MEGIILIGFMGAGKTTVGKLLAQRIGMKHMDFDDKIVEEIGMTIQEYFHLYGETAFRKKETTILKKYLKNNQIISTGGGIVMELENRVLLKQMPVVVYLKTTPGVFLSRLKQDDATIRPLVVSKSPEEIIQIFQSRSFLYEESANLVVETDGRTPEEIVEVILSSIGRGCNE